jgi:hypothetical protein
MAAGTSECPLGQGGKPMNKILLALTILSAGAGGFLTARQSTALLQRQANTNRDAWLALTQLVAVAQTDQAGMVEHVRELKQALTRLEAVEVSALWSALQTNRGGRLTPELRERLLEELGFNWRSSEDFIVVSKEALRELDVVGMIRGDNLSDLAAILLALTPAERGKVEAAIQSVRKEFEDWALAHIERNEPKDDVVAQYSLPADPSMFQSISNNFVSRAFEELGRDRAQLLLPSARTWMISPLRLGLRSFPKTIIIKRYLDGNAPRLNVQVFNFYGTPSQQGIVKARDLLPNVPFPRSFLPIFPNGWADVAEREGFEMPKETPKE